jgi:hypothetical protein
MVKTAPEVTLGKSFMKTGNEISFIGNAPLQNIYTSSVLLENQRKRCYIRTLVLEFHGHIKGARTVTNIYWPGTETNVIAIWICCIHLLTWQTSVIFFTGIYQ